MLTRRLPRPAPGATDLPDRDNSCKTRWNATVTRLHGHLRQSWEWGEVAGHPTHRQVILRDGEPALAVAMTEIRLPGLPYTVLYASRGPVVGPATTAEWSALVESLRETGVRRRAVVIRLSPAAPVGDGMLPRQLTEQGAVTLPEQWSAWNAPRVVMFLDVRGTEADLKRRMRDSTRLSLTKATKRGAVLERLTGVEGVERFHRLLVDTGRQRRYPVRRWEYFDALRRQYVAAGTGVVVLASVEGRAIAGVLGVRFGEVGYVLYAGLDPAFRALRAGVAVHWEFLRWVREQGCRTVDWGGAVTGYPPSEHDRGYGIYDFKLSFGASVTLLSPYVDIVLRPTLYRAFRLVERHADRLAALRARFN